MKAIIRLIEEKDNEALAGDCAELVKFYLSKESRGKGIGKELMERCI